MLLQKACSNRFLLPALFISFILAACSTSQLEKARVIVSGSATTTNVDHTLSIQPTLTELVIPDPTATSAPSTTLVPAWTEIPVKPTGTSKPEPDAPTGSIAGIEVLPNRADIELPLVQQAGAAWIRVNAILWSDVEPVKGQRDWNAIKGQGDLMVSASNLGLRTIMVVRGTPPWARKVPDSQCGPIRNDQFQAFSDFMVELVSRFSAPPYNVEYWEIWNEPDVDPSLVKSESIFGCWGDQNDLYYGGQYYGSLLKAIYPQIKAAKPNVKVVVGGLLLDCDPINPPEWPPDSGQIKDCSPARFLEGILESGAGNSFDAVSFHAYDYYGEQLGIYGNPNWGAAWNTTGPVATQKVEYIRRLLARFGVQKEILNTETALICASRQLLCSSDEFELTKAYYAALSLGASQMLGLGVNIWYSTIGWRSSGLFGANYQVLPVYESYRFSIRELDQATFQRRVDDYPGLSGLEFERAGTIIWLIWSLEDIGQTIHLPEAPSTVYDLFGISQETGRNIMVTMAPIYLEWAP